MNAWLILILSILVEVCGTTCMKLSNGFTKLVPSVAVFVFYGLSFWGFSLALKKQLELGLAYAVWAGVGTALVALIGFIFFGDRVTALKLVSMLLIIAGVIGLKFSSPA